jgi:hypothetical protein
MVPGALIGCCRGGRLGFLGRRSRFIMLMPALLRDDPGREDQKGEEHKNNT